MIPPRRFIRHASCVRHSAPVHLVTRHVYGSFCGPGAAPLLVMYRMIGLPPLSKLRYFSSTTRVAVRVWPAAEYTRVTIESDGLLTSKLWQSAQRLALE